jgi:hypothetical protein
MNENTGGAGRVLTSRLLHRRRFRPVEYLQYSIGAGGVLNYTVRIRYFACLCDTYCSQTELKNGLLLTLMGSAYSSNCAC